MDNIGQRLKEMIEEKDLTLLAFSEKVGIQRSSLSHLFSGRNKPSIDLLLKIKHRFPEIDLEWLITGKALKFNDASSEEGSDKAETAQKVDVTDVNTSDFVTDTQVIKTIEGGLTNKESCDKEIERIVLFYKDGRFKEYKNT